MTIIHASGRHLRSCLLLFSLVVLASCSNGEQRHAQSPTSPSIAADGAATGDTAGTASTSSADSGIIDRSTPGSAWLKGGRNSSQAVDFPRRDGTLPVPPAAESDVPRRVCAVPPTASFVDIEGTIVWTQEYLRYRVNGCSTSGRDHPRHRADSRAGVQPMCADFTGHDGEFSAAQRAVRVPAGARADLSRRTPPRRRADFVDAEGDIVWTQEYLRYRLNGCSHHRCERPRAVAGDRRPGAAGVHGRHDAAAADQR